MSFVRSRRSPLRLRTNDKQSAQQSNEICSESNDRFGLKSQGRVVYYFQASMMSLKSAALSDAPPIKPPSMSSLAKSSGAFLPLQEPP